MNKELDQIVEDNTAVEMDYILTVDGEIADEGRLEYLQGHGNIIAGLEKGLEGAKVGETRNVHVLAAEAYGEHDPKRVLPVNRSSFPEDFEFKLGEPMRIRDASGLVFQAIPVALSEEIVELDLNHPMAARIWVRSDYPEHPPRDGSRNCTNGSLHFGGCAGCNQEFGDDPSTCSG